MMALLFRDRLDVLGGTQRVFLATLETLYQIGFKIYLATLYKPDLCGVNEGVPREYVYKNLEEATRIIKENINAPIHKRVELSNYAKRFAEQTFEAKLKLVISNVLDLRGYDS